MKYFVVFGLFIFLGMMFYIDLVNFIFKGEYHEGLKVLPVILLANLFFGIYFTLSLWYKLTDKTRYGAYMAITGSVITVLINFILIPIIGYMGSAIAFCTSSIIITVISYFLGKKHYPIPYDLKIMAIYFIVAMAMFFISIYTQTLLPIIKYSLNTVMFILFFLFVYSKEKTNIKMLLKINK
jgi:O-antigen/teichoic acid export membrane protein